MKFSKEIVLLAIPFLFTTFISSLSNWYNFKNDENNSYYNALIEQRKKKFHNENQLLIINYNLHLHDKIENREKYIIEKYKKVRNHKKLTRVEKDSLYLLLLDVSEDIGTIKGYSKVKTEDSLTISGLNEYLYSEKKLIIAVDENVNIDEAFYRYIENNSTILKVSHLNSQKIKFESEDDDLNSKKLIQDNNEYEILSRLNFVVSALSIILLVYLIFHGFINKLFNKSS